MHMLMMILIVIVILTLLEQNNMVGTAVSVWKSSFDNQENTCRLWLSLFCFWNMYVKAEKLVSQRELCAVDCRCYVWPQTTIPVNNSTLDSRGGKNLCKCTEIYYKRDATFNVFVARSVILLYLFIHFCFDLMIFQICYHRNS